MLLNVILFTRTIGGTPMQLVGLHEEELRRKAHEQFPGYYIDFDKADLFLRDEEQGKGTIDGIDHPIFVSTHYVYEDHLVNNNKTRYKVHVDIFCVKKDAYEVIYDSRDICYVAYQDEGEIKFILYEDFYDFIKKGIHIEQ